MRDDDPTILHRRTITIEAREVDDSYRVDCRIRDERPWGEHEIRRVVHDMELAVTVRSSDLTITRAAATMHAFPHQECPAITPAFVELEGMQIGRGFTREVQRRLGGPRGCAHLQHLSRVLAPAVVQTVASAHAKRGWVIEPEGPPTTFLRDTCHLWTERGVAEQKLALGWRPSMDDEEYPVPPVDEIRRRFDRPD